MNWSFFNPFRSRKMTAHDLASPEAKAAAAWIETFNPLRGMTAQRMQNLFDAARDGNTVELQWLYNEIERVDPTLLVVSERRTGALASLGWSIKRRGGRKIDETLADEQLDALERCFFAADSTNLTEACKHLAGAFFRGFAHCAPIWKDAVTLDRLDALDAWNFVRDIRTGDWYWNPSAGPSLYARDLALIPRGELVSLVHSKHVDYPAMGIYLRSAVGEKGWGQFVERYGIPPVIIIMPPDMGDRAEEYRAHAENVARGGCGALASGSDVKYATEARGVQPFHEFLKHQQELIVLMATGGMLTTLTEAGSGTLAGGAHADSWSEIRRMDASLIASALNRQISDAVLDRAFPGLPHLAYFDFDTEATPSPSEVFDDATKARAAGYLVAQDDLEERTGYKLVKDEPAPQPGGLGAPFMNKAPAPSGARPLADETQEKSGENAVLAAFAQDTGPAADAIRALLADPSPEAAKKLLDDLPSLIPEDPALSAVIAEAMAAEFCSVPSAKAGLIESTEEEIENSQCHITDHLCRIHDAKKIEELSKKTADDAQRDCRLALEKMLKDHEPAVDCIWRKATGVIDLEWGDETGGICHIISGGHGGNIMSLPAVLAKGAIYKDKQRGRIRDDRFAVVYGQQLAILNKDENGCYVLTGFHPNARSYIKELKRNNPPLETSR